MKTTTVGERIEKLIDKEGITIYTLERKLNLSNGTLRKAIDKNSDSLLKYVDKIANLYPHHELFLKNNSQKSSIYTDGENLENTEYEANIAEEKPKYSLYKKIPVYNVDGPNDEISLFNRSINLPPAFYFTMPELSDCDFGLRYYGKSMEPEIESGDYLALKSVSTKIVQFGETFFIVTKDNQRMVRKIKKSSDLQSFLFAAINSQFDEFEVPKDQVQQLFIIKAILKQKVI